MNLKQVTYTTFVTFGVPQGPARGPLMIKKGIALIRKLVRTTLIVSSLSICGFDCLGTLKLFKTTSYQLVKSNHSNSLIIWND